MFIHVYDAILHTQVWYNLTYPYCILEHATAPVAKVLDGMEVIVFIAR